MSETDKTEAILKRLDHLEAIEEIRNMKQGAAVAADPNMDIDAFVNLYTEDGIMEIVNWETVLNGHDEIRAFLEVNPFTWMFHCLIPIKIDIAEDCQSATARWYLFEAATVFNSRTSEYDPVWVAGAYDDSMIKVNDEWKLTHSALTQEILCRYDEGWGKTRVNVDKDWTKPVDELLQKINK
jgi:ketosteroid isomerase-like protein